MFQDSEQFCSHWRLRELIVFVTRNPYLRRTFLDAYLTVVTVDVRLKTFRVIILIFIRFPFFPYFYAQCACTLFSSWWNCGDDKCIWMRNRSEGEVMSLYLCTPIQKHNVWKSLKISHWIFTPKIQPICIKNCRNSKISFWGENSKNTLRLLV